MKWSKWIVSMLMLVLMMSLVSLRAVQSPDCPDEPIGYQGVTAKVLVGYQVWHGPQDPPSHRCAFLPLEWPYDSRDTDVILRHIQEAKARGISGFVVDWYGPAEEGLGNSIDRGFMDDATKALFEVAESQDFLVALMYDDQTVKYAVPDDCENYVTRVKCDLEYARDNYFTSPAYLEINGCPALFIFPDDYVKACLYNKWGEITEHLGDPVTLLDRDPNPWDEREYDANFDGFYAWVTPTKGLWDPNGREWGKEYLEWFYKTMLVEYADKVAVGGVWPGFDDSLAPWSENRYIARYQPEGLTHDLTLKLAEDNNIEYILVGTWNDFEEGTDIEYGVRMLVDMEKPDPEVLIRSSPVKVIWNSDIPSADLEIWMTYEFINYEFIDKQPFSCGNYLSLTPGNLYELKLWVNGSPYSKWIKFRRIDPVPDEDPIVFETETITVTSPSSGESWQVNSSQTITWTSTGTVGDVQIQYSLNNGCDWSTITSSTENDGSFPWIAPNVKTNKGLIRVSETDGIPSGKSGIFSIVTVGPAPPRTITLRSPNGGEKWVTGSKQLIKWISSGDINTVTIYCSRDNGATWEVISQNTPNDGSFTWDVRGNASNQCLIRVAASDSDLDPSPSDTSDALFSILPPESPSIEVTAPNGEEQLTAGSLFTISWETTGSRENVEIQYSTNSGQTWKEITGAAENTGKYEWSVPFDPSNNCLVRVQNTGGQPTDESDEEFSIFSPAPCDITVTSPNGGESWPPGSNQEIKWTTNSGIDNVTIEYSRDNGTTWQEIIAATTNNGIFAWNLPGIASDECLVRITSNNALSDPQTSDVSDAVFSIPGPSSPELTVKTPNGGEQLLVGSLFTIKWATIGSREPVKIEYSVTNGDTWVLIIDGTENNGKYDWLVPDEPSETCLVRISETNLELIDKSDNIFSIVRPTPGEITVTCPNGGENWVVGSLQVISWSGGQEINNVTIYCSTDTGTTWQTIVQNTANNGSFDWIIPDNVSENCLVQVMANDGGDEPKPSDKSDQVFSIIPEFADELRVTSPNGGEEWEVGSDQVITWTGSPEINSVTLEYSYDSGNTWTIIGSSAENNGTHNWHVPETVSNVCLVRVTSNDGDSDSQLSDISDSEFSIVPPTSPTIRVITPNGGEKLVIGMMYEITWFATDSRVEVKIEYSINGETWKEIIGATENDGEYDWLVPDEPSETCYVRISQLEGQPVDKSDAPFSIVSTLPGNLTVLTPNGGENLEAGSEFEITWTVSDLNHVILEYSVSNGAAWQYIDKVPADNGGFTWTVPGTPSETCLVRVSGADGDENHTDVSDGIFTISDLSQTSIEVFTPNGGESLSVGEEYYITWASTGVDNILIEYSPDNGDEWITIDTVPAKGGRFTWTVPDTPTVSCLIRVTGNDSPGGPLDVSDAPFSIISD